MLQPGKAVKVTIYLSEGAKHRGVLVYSSILDFLFYRGVSGATVTRGLAGFGADHHMHSLSSVEISDRLPIKIEIVETRDKVEQFLGKLEELTGTGLIEMFQETTVLKPAQASKSARPAPTAHLKIEGKAQMMRIYLSEEDRWQNKPLYEALVEAMRANDIAGVTVYRGILGYGAHRRMHNDKPLPSHHGSVMPLGNRHRRKLQSFLPIVDQMVLEGLVVFSRLTLSTRVHRAPSDANPK